jgi:hypothetical protein
MMGFGKLLPLCYNGHARIVNKEATPLEFTTDSLKERKITSVFISKDEKANLTGSFQQTLGSVESYWTRERVQGKGIEEYFKDVKKEYGFEMEIKEKGIDSLKKPEEPLAVHYNFNLKPGDEDIIYFNPMMSEGYKENPFKSAVRLYPVEMPYTSDETYVIRMDVPEGYEIDELPKSVRVNFDEEGASYFEYMIGETGGTVSLRSRVKLNRSFFMPDEYEILREFFGMIVNKHNEQIVFKKKK